MAINSPANKERFVFMDMAKGLGIILIVIGHNIGEGWLSRWIFSFHVPLFFFISGFFYKERSWKEEFCTGWRLLLRPFYVTGLIIFLLSLILPGIFHIAPTESWFWWIKEHHIASFLLGCSHWGHYEVMGSWFLIALFWSKLAMKATAGFNNYIRLAIFIGLFLLAEFMARKGLYWEIPLYIVPSLAAPLFFFVGSMLKRSEIIKHQIDIKSFVAFLLILGIAVFVPVNTRIAKYPLSVFNVGTSLAISIAIIGVLKAVSKQRSLNWVNTFLSYCGRYSLVILCFHGIESSAYSGEYLAFMPDLLIGLIKVFILALVPFLVMRVPYLGEIYNVK